MRAGVLVRYGIAALALCPSNAPAQTAPTPAPANAAKRVFLPADFARFAPKTAFDMLAQVPGFTIRQADNGRGLGQASENVLINGQRVADKSGGAVDQLRKTAAATVERVEIADAASLGIAGLVGPVANVIVHASKSGSGRFEWKPNVRAHYTRPNLFRGSASYSGKRGPADYTVSLEDNGGRGGFGGPVVITDAAGTVIERRRESYSGAADLVTLKTQVALDGPGSSTAKLTLAVTPYWQPSVDRERRVRTDGDDRTRLTRSTRNGAYYDINAEGDAALGPGRLKLIGVRHQDHEPSLTTQVTRFDSGADAQGIRFDRQAVSAETVGRAEYRWKGGRTGWQASLERALNTLDQRGALATLSPAGSFVAVPFPGGSGQVRELRYETLVTASRPLSRKLDLQIVGGAEQSSLARVDADAAPRRFFRPKGSASLAWRPAAGWDVSLKLSRRVGQIDFYDFLSQPNLRQDRQNAGNPDLVPPQSWEAESEIGRELGHWGKTRLRTYAYRVTDIVDYVPVGDDGEGVGNLPRARRFGAESTSTLLFDPIGWRGAKLDATLGFEHTSVRDPLTGLPRPISETRDRWVGLDLRRDVPGSPLAWGASANSDHYGRVFYLTEVSESSEGPWFVSAFVEHKDVLGLTVRAQAGNLLNARHRYDRFVYDGRRTAAPLLFRQQADQLIGPLFSLTVSGSF